MPPASDGAKLRTSSLRVEFKKTRETLRGNPRSPTRRLWPSLSQSIGDSPSLRAAESGWGSPPSKGYSQRLRSGSRANTYFPSGETSSPRVPSGVIEWVFPSARFIQYVRAGRFGSEAVKTIAFPFGTQATPRCSRASCESGRICPIPVGNSSNCLGEELSTATTHLPSGESLGYEPLPNRTAEDPSMPLMKME